MMKCKGQECTHFKTLVEDSAMCVTGNCTHEKGDADGCPLSELKPCPFCGAPAEFDEHEAYSLDSSFDYVGCTNDDCGAMLMNGTLEEWNKRMSNATS